MIDGCKQKNYMELTETEQAELTERLRIDAELTRAAAEAAVPSPRIGTDAADPTLSEAMRYSLLSGGKKIRPALVIETCRLFGGTEDAAAAFACALEMIHTYSLIHDDLPCMDNDDLRRGKPTNHKVYGEAIAVLAGDALLTDAFRVAAGNPFVDAETRVEAVTVLSEAAGSLGMVSGQVMDMKGEEKRLSREELTELHSRKTGALMRAAVRLGCLAAGVPSADERTSNMIRYADKIGLAFQVVDDVLDVTSRPSVLGKSVGKDRAEGKTTFLTYDSPEGAAEYAAELTAEAVRTLEPYPGNRVLLSLAKYLLTRKN